MVALTCRVFVPRAGARVMSVHGVDRAQVVAFQREAHASRVVQLLARGDALTIDGVVLTAPASLDGGSDRDPALNVLETSVRELQQALPDIGVYVCELDGVADVTVRETLLGGGESPSLSLNAMRAVVERCFRL